MKNDKRETLVVALILFTAVAIVASFYIYDSGSPLEKRNAALAFSMAAAEDEEKQQPASGAAIPPPATSDTIQPKEPQAEDTVYISKTGSKYHKTADCGSMDPAKAKSLTLQEAEDAGKTPCKICFPSG